MSSHDHYCEKCGVHYSPFDFDACPCGNEGIYDPNSEFGKVTSFNVDDSCTVEDLENNLIDTFKRMK